MEYTQLGSTGTSVSKFCFGTWRFGRQSESTTETTREEAYRLLDTAWDHGINFIDTANAYGDPQGTSESWIGDWLSEYVREDFVLASKVYYPMGDGPNQAGLGRKHIRNQIEASLERLGTDYLDIYYIHRWDESIPIEETLATLHELVRDGTVNHLGASTMAAWQLTKALWKSDVNDWTPFTVTQPKYNAVHREEVAEYLDLCIDQELAVCPYSPLERGFLTGKYRRGTSAPDGSRATLDSSFSPESLPDQAWAVLDEIREIAAAEEVTPAQVSLRWLVDHDQFTCVPILGARTPDHLAENLASLSISLSDAQRTRITKAYSTASDA